MIVEILRSEEQTLEGKQEQKRKQKQKQRQLRKLPSLKYLESQFKLNNNN